MKKERKKSSQRPTKMTGGVEYLWSVYFRIVFAAQIHRTERTDEKKTQLIDTELNLKPLLLFMSFDCMINE